MRFLVDAQLPPSLATILCGKGHDAVHIYDIASPNVDDRAIWQLAIQEKRIIISKDEDFAARIKLNPDGPQILWLRVGNCSKSELSVWFDLRLSAIIQSLERGDLLVIAI